MLPNEVIDTSHLPPAERYDFWLQTVNHSTGPSHVYSDHARNFTASARVILLGGLQLMSFRYPSLEMRRTSKFIRQFDPEAYQLVLPVAGRSAITQERQESSLGGNHLSLLETSRPHGAIHAPTPSGEPFNTLMLQLPRSMLRLPSNKLKDLFAAPIPADQGMGKLLGDFVRSLAAHPEQHSAETAAQVGAIALDMLTVTLSQLVDLERMVPVEAQNQALRARIDAFINQHLGDDGLTPATVAAAHHISLRTLHRLFQGEDMTVGELIRTRRLERCRRDLINPLMATQPIYAIAARWGFPDKAHFSRLFRATYGLSPQEYRTQPDRLSGSWSA